MTSIRAVLVAVAIVCLALTPGFAASPADIAKGIDSAAVQIVTGGNWEDAGKKGYYRAVLIAPATTSGSAELYLQWFQASKDQASPGLVFQVPVKEVNDLKLTDATLSMETQNTNEFIFYVEPNDPSKDTLQSFSVSATLPGKYTAIAGALPE